MTTEHYRERRMPDVSATGSPFPAGCENELWDPATGSRAEYCPAPLAPSGNRLRIAFRITGRQLQGTVDIACRTDRMHTRTTILWCRRIDDFSRRLLADALRAGDPGEPVRIQAFAAAARDLLRYTLRTLITSHKDRPLRARFGHSPRHPQPPGCIDDSARRRDELLAAIADLLGHTRLRPRVTVVQGAEAAGSLSQALSAVVAMTDSIVDFLEQVLQPLPRAFVLEIRAEFEDLAPRRMDHQVYTQRLTATRVSARTVCVELEACPGCAQPRIFSL
ncbi:MAG: hypothetical protein OXP66_06630 [Candidatus Tectomicrobia bacterium]|nr:hypothetical protein [Candidatus Tectomicrobia bacterium]